MAATGALAADWPTWQHDAGRSAATEEALPERPTVLWVRQFPVPKPCWEDPVNQDRMPFDASLEPVVAGQILVVASNRDDSVRAVDTRTGRDLWQAVTGAPVRLPPVLHDGRVHAVSDDGFLYTWGLADGRLLWCARGGRDERRVLGNGRLVSAWCARGGPVLLGDTLYFGAGIWPFMGTTMRALDPATGTPVWTQALLGDLYLKHPHGGAESFGALAPQGACAAAGDRLVVPNGRSLPAVLRRTDGSLLHFRLDGSVVHETGEAPDRKLEGGSYVCTDGRYLVNHRGIATGLYDLESGNAYMLWKGLHHPVLSQGLLHLGGETLRSYRLTDLQLVSYETTATDKKTGEKQKITRRRWELPALWELPLKATGALLRAGPQLTAAEAGTITSIDLSQNPPATAWTVTIEGRITRLIVADGCLFAVTAEGHLHCLGTRPKASPVPPAAPPIPVPLTSAHPWKALATELTLPVGWALVYGTAELAAIEALLSRPGLSVIVVQEDADTVAELRRRLHDRGLYGERASVQQGTVESFLAPPYLALLVILTPPALATDAAALRAAYESVRPYGGRLYIEGDAARLRAMVAQAGLPGATVAELLTGLLVTRTGPLPGAAPWTHQYGDAANSAKSHDTRVMAPLGLLWFGGNSHHDILPRHGHGPAEQVLGGRLFVQGINSLSARDVYTGADLWKRQFGDLGTAGIYYDSTYCEDPLDTTYNQRHIPGANARGANLATAADAVYLLNGTQCLVLDPTDGRTRAAFALPADADTGTPPTWAYLGLVGDVLVGGTGFSTFSQAYTIDRGDVWDNFDVSSSRGLAALDRHTGEVLWQRSARLGFRHNAICADAETLYCIDALPALVLDRLQRRGHVPRDQPELLALDVRTGRERWSRAEGAFGTWLSVSAKHGLLLQSGRASRDALKDESGERLMALRTADGSVAWDRKGAFGGPIMLHHETIYTSAVSTSGGALSLITGEPLMRPHPLTRQRVPWTYHRRYGCNAVIASEHLLTFRSGAAGFYDLRADAGTANLGGFKSGCTANLIVADGVLNAPDYTRTCTCSYQNQTSLAFVHTPDIEVWTANDIQRGPGRILDLPINFGAPGDRREQDGPVWFEFPIVGGPSPELPVTIEDPAPTWFRLTTPEASGDLPWLAASGLEGEARLLIDLLDADAKLRTVRLPTAAKTDDAEEADGEVLHGSSDLELVRDRQDQTVAIRIAAVPLAAEEAIAAAYLAFTADEPSDEATELTIRAQADDDAPALGKQRQDLSKRPLTQAEVKWVVPAWPKAGAATAAQCSPDLTPLLREVTARPGWRPGQAMVFVIQGRGRRVARSADNADGGGPCLAIAFPKSAAELAAEPAVTYALRLVFAEPEPVSRGRAFDVLVQGAVAIPGLRLDGPVRQAVVRELRNLRLHDHLSLELRASPGSPAPPVLCGVHLRAEEAP
jgi:outer membrane protein assembly factor BamB